jgi:hypothetical protein
VNTYSGRSTWNTRPYRRTCARCNSLDAERNPEAVDVVGSVFAEEMLHLALAANLLNAVGGRWWAMPLRL